MSVTATNTQTQANTNTNTGNPGFPRLERLPVCMKCDGSGTYRFTMAPKLGESGPCTRCSKGRMTGHDIARYWAWQTEGYKLATLRVVIQNIDGVESQRDFAPDTQVYVGDQWSKWCWVFAEDLRLDDFVLIPRVQSHETLVCRVVGVVRKSRR